jgi:hypothetical protein
MPIFRLVRQLESGTSRIRRRARVLESGDEVDRALALLDAKYAQYREAPPGVPVLAVDLDEWRAWSAER